MHAVNLLPRQDTDRVSKATAVPALVACVGMAVAAAVLALLFLSASSQVAHERTALQRAQAEYAAIPAPPPPSPVVSQLPQQRQSRMAALAAALGQRVAWDRLLREVSQVVPSDVWLVTLAAQSPATAAPVPGAAASVPPAQGFTVVGCTYTQESVARFLARIALVPDLSGMTLGKSSASSPGGSDISTCPQRMITFTLLGSVRTAGTSS